MNNPKRHHYVSQFILRNFTDEKGRLHYFSRLWAAPEVRAGVPDKIFFESYLYSSISKDGARDPRLETAYSKLEGAAQPLLQKITDAAQKNLAPHLSPSERDGLSIFLYHHIKRSPDFVDGKSTVEFEDLLDKAAADFIRDNRALSDAERAEFETPMVRQRMMQNAKVIARSRGSAEVRAAFASRGIGIAKIVNPKKNFVIGSYPYAQLSAPGIFNVPAGAVEMWFPISEKVAITFFGQPFSEFFIQVDDAGVRAINEKIALSSNVIAGCSAALIKSLSRLMNGPLVDSKTPPA